MTSFGFRPATCFLKRVCICKQSIEILLSNLPIYNTAMILGLFCTQTCFFGGTQWNTGNGCWCGVGFEQGGGQGIFIFDNEKNRYINQTNLL